MPRRAGFPGRSISSSPAASPWICRSQVRMGGIGSYDVIADAVGEGLLKAKDRKNTDVIGMADVDLVVSESKRVVDVGGTTTFQIRLRNYGTKEATHLAGHGQPVEATSNLRTPAAARRTFKSPTQQERPRRQV